MNRSSASLATQQQNIVKQDQVINTAALPSTTTKKENRTSTSSSSSNGNVVQSLRRLFINCFQTSSAVVIDYSSTATRALTPSKVKSKKRLNPKRTTSKGNTSTAVVKEIKMMLNNTNTTSQNPYGCNYARQKQTGAKQLRNERKTNFSSLQNANSERCESPRITKRKKLPNSHQQMPYYEHTVCGQYSLEKSLQNGYSGKVFKGHYLDPEQHVPVVVKCCKKLSSWNTETRALQNLDHPNIIKLVGRPEANVPATPYTGSANSSGNENKQRNRHLTPDSSPTRNPPSNLPLIHVLAQELASNGDLYELLQCHGSFNETMARTIIKPIVEGLLHAYECKGISHRDIKLENIFIAEDGTIKIGDWGLSGFDTRDRYCSSSCGTLGYMAPEMVCREKYDANKTDVWAIAVVLFSLCTGVRPYSEPKSRRKNPNDFSWRDEWLGAMMASKWQLWWMSHARTTPAVKDMSIELRNLFERMFTGDMNERASLAEVLDHPWMNGPTSSNHDIVNLCRSNRRRNSK